MFFMAAPQQSLFAFANVSTAKLAPATECTADELDSTAVLTRIELLPLNTAPACKIIDFDNLSKRDPTSLRWVNTTDVQIDLALMSEKIWLSQTQARAWLSGASTSLAAQATRQTSLAEQATRQTSQVVLVGTGVDDHLLARRCGEMFEGAHAIVLRDGLTRLTGSPPMLAANQALSALLNAQPNTLTLVSAGAIKPEFAQRLRSAGVRVVQAAHTQNAHSGAVIELAGQRDHARAKPRLHFNIVGGLDALQAAYTQSTALALAPKNAPRRPCYFP
jgi:hypothetical protein